ncbi:MAG: transmembrane permease, partial [Flavobacteriales bacterium]
IADKKYQRSVSAPIIRIGIISIALGIVVMLVAVATTIGMQKKIKDKVTGFNGAIQLSSMENVSALNATIPMVYSDTLKDIIESNPEVSHVQVFANRSGIIRTQTDFEGVVLKGVGATYNWHFFDDYLTAGSLPVLGDEVSNDVLLSQTIADRLKLNVGDDIRVWFMREGINKPPWVRKLTIKGLFSTGFPEFDNNFAIGDIRHLQKLNKWQPNQVGGIEVFVKDFDQINEVKMALYNKSPMGINTQSVFDEFPNIFDWIALFDSNVLIIIVIMVLIAGFNMISVIMVLILEQTPTIGILKAMGATNQQIRNIFLYQATYLVFKGLIWGNVIGLGFLLLQYFFKIIKLNPETYHVSSV